MNKEQIKRIREQMKPDDRVIENLFESVDKSSKKGASWIYKGLLITSMAVLAFTLKQPGKVVDSIKGLPKQEFIISNNYAEVSRDRLFATLAPFFEKDMSLLVLRVNSVENEEERMGTKSEVNATVIMNLHGPQVEKIINFTDYTLKPVTTLWSQEVVNEQMRVGGVYIIPLSSDFTNRGSFDVLFEIDDEGKIDSHSSHQWFNQYDGSTLEDFIESLTVLTESELFMNNISLADVLLMNGIIKVDSQLKTPTQNEDKYSWESVLVTDSLGLDVPNIISVESYDQPMMFNYVVGRDGTWHPIEAGYERYFLGAHSDDEFKVDETLITEIQKLIKEYRKFFENK